MLLSTLLCVCLCVLKGAWSDTTVTIYNEYQSQGGRVHYEVNRWNQHNGLTHSNLIPKCKGIRTETGRWLNRDLNDHLFADWPQDHNHHGYPDPRHLNDQTRSRKMFSYYMENVHGYGHDLNMVWETKSMSWPNWMDKSHHKGQFPNNVDAAAEFVALMVQGAKDYGGGHLPPYFEVINEPDAHWQELDTKTVIDYHRVVAQKLKSRFGIKVGGPTYTSYFATADRNNFNVWHKAAQFLDMSLDHMDFFSFHAYNHVHVNGNSHYFTGVNEARLVALIDLIENYSHKKKGKKFPIIVSEFGRGSVKGISQDAHSGIVDFATVFHSIAQGFTYLNYREFMERAIVWLSSNEQYRGHTSENWSLFTKDGHELKAALVFRFWQNLSQDHKFLKLTSDYSGLERVVSPHALANPKTGEVVVLLHNYGTGLQNVHLDFKNGWTNPTTGHSTCIFYKNGNVDIHSNVNFDTNLNHGKVGLPGEASCIYKFHVSTNLNSLRTTNEDTYYGNDMVIPIHNNHAQTTIKVPGSGFHSARMRIGVSKDNKSQNAKPTSVTVNGHKLPSSYMLYDSDKDSAPTKWQVWEYWVPENQVHGSNTVDIHFDSSGGHVSTVALIVGKLQ